MSKFRSFSHPLGLDVSIPSRIDPARLLELVGKLRTGQATDQDREEIAVGHIRLALAIAARHASPSYRQLDDYVSCALFGIVYAINCAQEKLEDDNITAWIAGAIHGHCRRFKATDHLVTVPQTTNADRRSRGEEVIKLPACVRLADENVLAREPDQLDNIRELLFVAAEDDCDRSIIELRIKGYNDEEVAAQVGKSKSYVNQRRHVIEARYDRLL